MAALLHSATTLVTAPCFERDEAVLPVRMLRAARAYTTTTHKAHKVGGGLWTRAVNAVPKTRTRCIPGVRNTVPPCARADLLCDTAIRHSFG
jgi:hypothetical protein